MDAKIRKLKSEDNQVFEVEVESLKLSKFLMDLINDFPDDEDEITINQVDGKNLKLIVDYLNQYKNKKIKEIPKPLPSGDLKLYLDEWDYNYINPLSLEESIDLEVKLVDERLSTVSAENILIESNMRRENRKKVIDSVAATIILDTYLGSVKTNEE